MVRVALTLAFVSGVMVLSAQSPAVVQTEPPLAFEVASIKPHNLDRTYRVSFLPGGGFTGTLPLEWLIMIAYEVRPPERIVGEPSWVRTQYFTIEAKPSAQASRSESLAMLRTLIEERFGLVWRKDPSGKAIVYALTMAREDKTLGPAIRQAEIECVKSGAPMRPTSDRRLQAGVPVPCGSALGADGVSAGGSMPISMLVATIQLMLGEEVVDRTGLSGNFDYFVTLPRTGQNPGAQGPADVSIFTAIREQLGMELQREEITRDAFVVEKVSQPTPN